MSLDFNAIRMHNLSIDVSVNILMELELLMDCLQKLICTSNQACSPLGTLSLLSWADHVILPGLA